MSATKVQIVQDPILLAEQTAELRADCVLALSQCRFDGVIASFTAARLHGLWLPSTVDRRIHVATATAGSPGRRMSRTRRQHLIPHRYQLTDADLVLLDGVLVTSLARTWRDLAGALSLPDLVAAGDCALRSGASVADLQMAIDRGSPHHHVRLARQAFDLLDARSRSRPESHLRVAISGCGLPKFEVNIPVHWDEGGWLAEPDLSLKEARIALEYQGSHHAGRMQSDITRFGDLRRADWLAIPYGPVEVFQRPWQIAPELRVHIARRAPHLLARSHSVIVA